MATASGGESAAPGLPTGHMPAAGLLALLDDIAAIADDVATLSMAAAKKSVGIVTDDMAVTAEQAIGIRREREIPVVLAVAKGSLRNKLLILVPGALLLSAVAPGAITPLLMAGGAYLAFEGVEKVLHAVHARGEDVTEEVMPDPEVFERSRIEGAIRTDLILSGEIIALTLGGVAAEPLLTQAAVLFAVSLVMTVGVYGLVAGLIKLDDLGEYLYPFGGFRKWLGNYLIVGTPRLLHTISVVGTIAMLMVGGHILLEGIAKGIPAVEHALHALVARLSFPGVLTALDIVVGVVAGRVAVAAVSGAKVVRAKWESRVRA